MKRITLVVADVALAATLAGCESGGPTKQEVGVVGGAVAGGVVGNALGGSTFATVGGAAVGAVVGSEVGKSMDEKDN